MNTAKTQREEYEQRIEMYQDTIRSDVHIIEQLRSEVRRLKEYADKLAAGLLVGMLPKDVENLREANTKLATEVEEMTRAWNWALSRAIKLEKSVKELTGWNNAQRAALDDLRTITGVGGSCEEIVASVRKLKKYADEWVAITPERAVELRMEVEQLRKENLHLRQSMQVAIGGMTCSLHTASIQKT